MRKRTLLLLLTAAGVAGIAAFGLVSIRRGFSARDNPSWVETIVARTTRSMAVPAGAKRLKNPIPNTPDNLAEARAHFADHCATCHANNGSGDTEIGKNLYPKAPDMRLPQTQHLTDGSFTTPSTMVSGSPECLRGAQPRKTRTAGSWCFSYGICLSSRQQRNVKWKSSIRRVKGRNRRN